MGLTLHALRKLQSRGVFANASPQQADSNSTPEDHDALTYVADRVECDEDGRSDEPETSNLETPARDVTVALESVAASVPAWSADPRVGDDPSNDPPNQLDNPKSAPLASDTLGYDGVTCVIDEAAMSDHPPDASTGQQFDIGAERSDLSSEDLGVTQPVADVDGTLDIVEAQSPHLDPLPATVSDADDPEPIPADHPSASSSAVAARPPEDITRTVPVQVDAKPVADSEDDVNSPADADATKLPLYNPVIAPLDDLGVDDSPRVDDSYSEGRTEPDDRTGESAEPPSPAEPATQSFRDALLPHDEADQEPSDQEPSQWVPVDPDSHHSTGPAATEQEQVEAADNASQATEQADMTPLPSEEITTTPSTANVGIPLGKATTTAFETELFRKLASEDESQSIAGLCEEIIARANYRFPQSLAICSPQSTPRTADTIARVAIMLADKGEEILIVDANVRRPSLTKRFESEKYAGITDALRGQRNAIEIVRPTARARVFFAAAGQAGLGKKDPPSAKVCERLISELSRHYHHILIDVGSVDSPLFQTMGGTCEASILLVSHPTSKEALLKKASDKLRQLGNQPIGCIVTDVPQQAAPA